MISAKELNPHNYATTDEIQANLDTLLYRMNIVRTTWGKPMTVTSGLRSQADQTRINPNAPGSAHVRGAAVDIADPNKELQKWCKDNVQLLENAILWMEDFSATPTWCHFQIYPPKSGKRWFLP